MRVEDFNFNLPPELIAQQPVSPRDTAKLLDTSSQPLTHRLVRDLPDCLTADDLLIINNTKVLPARLKAKRGEASIDITLVKELGLNRWAAFAKPAKKARDGDTLVFGERLTAKVVSRDGMEVLLEFSHDFDTLVEGFHAYGAMPLPPYIKREEFREEDKSSYQTLFAEREGAVAAPTAGLHFTPELMAAIEAKGIRQAAVTLHVGAGTFLPVKVDDTKDHVMHSEWCELSEETAQAIAQTRKRGGRVVAVGTTALRTLEATKGQAGTLDTDIFITPGYQFQVVDMLLTNFHLPKSTLFMLVSAFTSLDFMQAAYAEAIANKYRFFSYGDACLLSCQNKA